jgi:transketolase
MVVAEQPSGVDALYSKASADFERYESIKDLVDECIDLMLNYRQSGHPGGSRSKVHMLLSLMFSGAMRWDLLRPWRPFGDRFVLSAGHTVPLVYATLAVLNEAFRVRYERDGDPRFQFPDDGQWALTWDLLLRLRRRGGLPGHAEMEGKTLFLKFNTGPSGHGMPPAVGEALALKHAGAEEVKVFVFEGEGGLTPGGAHEARHTAWGLGLSNLVFMIDWNDFGIDERPLSAVVYGTPEDWFSSYGWRVTGAPNGSDWADVTRATLEAARGDNPQGVPSMAWFKTRKGRGYGKYDYKSHGTPHTVNAPEFWTVRKQFMDKYGLTYAGVDAEVPADSGEREAQARTNFETALSVFRSNPDLTDWVTDRLLAVADSVPDDVDGFNLSDSGAVFSDKRVFDPRTYPPEIWKKPGEKHPNRAAYGAWGAYVNALAKREHGRPLFIGASADLG